MGHLDLYLEQLPNGLESFPGCLAKASMIRTALQTLPVPAERSDVPAVLKPHLARLPLSTAWVAETEYVAVCLALADLHGLDVEGFRRFWYGSMSRLITGMYESIFAWVLPATLLKNTAARWATFHRGTSLDAKAEGDGISMVLRYPTGLFPVIIVEGYVAVFQALIDKSRRPDARSRLVDIREESPGQQAATFLLEHWMD